MRLLGIAFETRSRRSITADTPRDAIATAIIGFARAGERDPERWVGSVGGGLRKLNLLLRRLHGWGGETRTRISVCERCI